MSRTIGTVLVNVEANTQKLVDGFDRAEKRVESATATMKSSLTKLTTAYLSFETVAGGGRILLDIVKNGVEVNRTMETLTNSLTRSSAVMMGNIDATGKAISTTEKYRLANVEAKNTLEQLQKANLETPHTLNETVKLYDSMYIGMSRAGATTSDMIEITKKLSIAVGNKVGFDAMLSAMDGLSSGTVEVSSDMGRFLNSIGLSNEAIKSSSNVIQLFKDKLSDFKAIDDFNTKLSNLTNSWDILTANLSKPIFTTLENNFDGITKVIDRMNNGLVKTIISLSTVDNLTEKSDLLLKRKLLLEEKKSISENKFMFDSDQKSKIQDINKELSILSGKLADIFTNEDALANKTKSDYRDIGTIISISGTSQQKFNKQLEDNVKNLKNAGATKEEISIFEAKAKKDFLDDQNKALLDVKKIGMTEYEKGLLSITEKTNELIKAGFSEKDVLFAKNKLLQELNKNTSFDSQKEYLSYYEKKIQLMDDSIEKELELEGLAYSNRVLEIQNSEKSIDEKNMLIAKETELYNTTIKSKNAKNEITLAKEDLSFYERKVQLINDSISGELELQGIAYANKILEIEATTKTIAEKDKLIAKENELFNLTVQTANYKYNTDFQDTMTSFYDDMLDSQLALNNAVFDFGAGFDGVSSKIGAVTKSIAAMSSLELTNKKEASKLDKKYIEQFNKYAGDVEKTSELAKQYEIDTGILKEQNIQAQIAGYANIAGAMSGMFKEGSREAASFQLIEGGLALASGIRAILTQGSGDPYTAFARMAAMAATVSSMLGNIGIAFGLNKTTTSSDSFSAMTANNGSGSVLGDSEAATKSITEALSTLKDFAKPEYDTLLSMNNYLETIATSIGGVTSLLIQSGGFAFGSGYTGFDTGYKNNISWGKANGGGALLLQPIDSIISKIPVVGQINAMMGNIMNTVIGGLFGKTKVSQSLTDSGIYFADTLLTSAIKQFDGQAYQTISTTVTKKSWFSKSSSTSVASYFDALDTETERQFSLVLSNLYNSVLVAGTALDSASTDTENLLSNFVVSLGKISLNGKTGDQIQETLTSIFGKVGDDLAKTAFPALIDFQQVGEGVYKTLTRVATGMENAEYYIGRLGNKFTDITYTSIINKQGDVAFEVLKQSIEKFDNATYGVNNNLIKIVDSLNSTASELYTVYTTLDGLRDRLIFLGQSSQGISSSMIYGAGSVDALSSGFSSYFDKFLSPSEQLAFKTQQLSDTFTNLGVQMPTTNTAFKDLLSSLDLTSSSGQELYGRLITLSDSFAEISSLRVSALKDELSVTTSSISNIKEISTSLDTVISNLKGGLNSSSTNLLDKFNKSMATSLLLSNGNDYAALQNSLKDTINYSSALNNSDYFGSLKDMQFAQSVAANQFESINLNLDDELSVLQKIETNTNEMINALSNLTSAVKTLNDSSSTIADNTAVSRIA